jgi:hypothetical protein
MSAAEFWAFAEGEDVSRRKYASLLIGTFLTAKLTKCKTNLSFALRPDHNVPQSRYCAS